MSSAVRNPARRRRWAIAVVVAAAIGGTLVARTPALAVHDLDFQLDGDVTSTPDTNVGGTTQEFDWADFFNAIGEEGPLPAGFDASTFDQDFNINANGTFNKSDTSTWATGSKDNLPITPGWQCKRDQNLLDKDDIMNAYAASYSPAGGDEVLYFGLERNGNNGAANVGFWFLQDDSVDCESPGGNTAFTGSHVDGDILVVSEFTNGGIVSTINVYRWNDPDGNGIDPNFGSHTPCLSGVDCRVGSGLNDDACATVNLIPIATPWLTVDKTSVDHTLTAREFFEGGLNLSDTGLGGRCFNTFIATTRASQEIGANLHDFSRGELGGCTSTTVTTPSTPLRRSRRTAHSA